MEAENDFGNIEYKLKLIGKDKNRKEELLTQMRYRMEEGSGECIYKLGVYDDGKIEGITIEEYIETKNTLDEICKANNYGMMLLVEKNICENKKIYELLIRENNINKYLDIKVAITGSVDAGKSSLLGILTSGVLDDGRGSARSYIFNFQHEIKSGRTSSLAHHILGFDSNGNIVNYNQKLGKISWGEVVSKSRKIISFTDMAGHEKYLKTTISGLSSLFPDVCFILVGANMGLTNMTKEHLFLCLTLKIPFIIIVTKIDIVKDRQNVYNETMENIYNLLKLPGIRLIPYKVKDKDDIIMCAEKIYSNSITPIFEVSNVSGEGINNLTSFLNLLGKKEKKYDENGKVEYIIDTIFKNVKGTGLVVGGTLLSGTIHIGDKFLLGPIDNNFSIVNIRSIHCKKLNLNSIGSHTYVCMGIKGIDKDIIRKGQVIISINSPQICIKQFKAEIKVLRSHSTTIKPGYEPIINTYNIRQSARLIEVIEKKSARGENITDNILRVGDTAIVKFQFVYRSEYVKPGYKIFLNEGRTKAVGVIIE